MNGKKIERYQKWEVIVQHVVLASLVRKRHCRSNPHDSVVPHRADGHDTSAKPRGKPHQILLTMQNKRTSSFLNDLMMVILQEDIFGLAAH